MGTAKTKGGKPEPPSGPRSPGSHRHTWITGARTSASSTMVLPELPDGSVGEAMFNEHVGCMPDIFGLETLRPVSAKLLIQASVLAM